MLACCSLRTQRLAAAVWIGIYCFLQSTVYLVIERFGIKPGKLGSTRWDKWRSQVDMEPA